MTASADPRDRSAVHFDAVLYPNRSLPPRGFLALMAAVVGVSAAVGGAFFLMGAWPVTGLLGLDALLLYLAFHLNYRAGRLTEFVRLDDRDGLTVRRVRPDGRAKTWRFEPHWVRVDIDDPPRHHSQLTLSSHGRSLTIGAFLTADERLEIARALRAALAEYRAVPAAV